jgi:hypothetical protein
MWMNFQAVRFGFGFPILWKMIAMGSNREG